MNDDAIAPDPAVLVVAAECERRGYVYGLDYGVSGVPGFIGSDAVLLGRDGLEYVVWCEERGRRLETARSANLDEVTPDFFDAVAQSAAYHRGKELEVEFTQSRSWSAFTAARNICSRAPAGRLRGCSP